MATVNGLTAEAMAAIKNGVIVGVTVNDSGDLIATHGDGSTSDAGHVVGPAGSYPDASPTAKGILYLATDLEAETGKDIAKAITPHSAAAAFNSMYAAIDRGRKNIVINGNFQINQHGYTSGSAFAADSYSFDRWRNMGRTNLAFNPTAAAATTAWALVNGSATLSRLTGLTIPGLVGVTTAVRSMNTASQANSLIWLGSQTSPFSLVTAGLYYTFSMYVRSSTATTYQINLNLLNSSGTLVTNLGGPTFALVTNVWTRISFTAVMPATVARAGVYALGTTAVPSGNTFDATAILIEGGLSLLPYFDGSFTGCSWVGTANASNSYVGSIAPTSPTLTYTVAPQGQTVTMNADSHIGQFVEQANTTAATMVLSWVGTATGRAYNKGTLSSALPAFAASGATFTIDGTDDVILEFATPSGATATLGQVQFEVGSVATSYEVLTIQEEFLLCYRYYWKGIQNVVNYRLAVGAQFSTTGAEFMFQLPVALRVTPLIQFGGNVGVANNSGGSTITSMVLQGANSTLYDVGVAFAASGGANEVCVMYCPTSGGYIAFFGDF